MDVIAGALGILFASFIPGHLLTSRDLPVDASPPERWALALGLGFWLVTFLATVTWLLPMHRLGLWEPPLLVTACAFIVSCAAWIRWRRRPLSLGPHPSRSDWLVLGLTAVVFILFFCGVDDEHFSYGCLYRSLVALSSHTPHEALPILLVKGDERFGNVAAVWTIRSLCPRAFERMSHGFFAALLFLSSAALGRRLTGRTWPGLLAAVGLVLTDDIFGFEVLNQNMIAAFTVTLLALCTLQGPYPSRAVVIAFLAAMLVSARCIAALGTGAWLLAATGGPFRGRLKQMGFLSGLLLVFLAPTLVHLATGSLRVETILGQRLLNFPFHDDLVRTPLRPFPSWIAWALHFLGTFGWLGVTLILSGWVWLIREQRRFAFVLAVFAVPVASFLFAQENWLEPEKMTIGLLFSPLAVAGIAYSLSRLFMAGGRFVQITVLGVGLGVASLWFVAKEVLPRVSFQEDARVRALYPGLPSETPDLLEFEKERSLAWRSFPAPRSAGVFRSAARKARDVARLFSSEESRGPSVNEYAEWLLDRTVFHRSLVERAIAPATGDPIVATRPFVLDLTRRPMLSARPLVPADFGEPTDAVLDLSDGRDCAMSPVEGWRTRYLDRPVRVLVCHRQGEAFVFTAPPMVPTLDPDDAPPPEVPPSWILKDNVDLSDRPFRDRVFLKLPAGVKRVTLVDILYFDPSRDYARTLDIRPDGSIEAGPPWIWHHN